MKKSLIALAALATVATVAQAQSNVTIYGVMDTGYASIDKVSATGATTNGRRVSGLQNGGLSTSRLGFRGTEDLGGGLKANFTLEAELLTDTGGTASSPEALFNRASWVGLSQDGVGSIQLGRMNTFSYDEAVKGDTFAGGNFGGFIAANNGFYSRIENAISLKTTNFKGFQAGIQTGTRTAAANNGAVLSSTTCGTSPTGTATTSHACTYGEVAGKTKGNRLTGMYASYVGGPLELAGSFSGLNNAEGKKISEITNLFARYNFGSIKLISGWAETKYKEVEVSSTSADESLGYESTDTIKTTTYFIGATAPVTANLKLMGNYIWVKNDRFDGSKTEPKVYALGAQYDLSKRTSLYALAAKSNQDNGSTQRVANSGKFNFSDNGTYTNGVAPVANGDQTGYMVGIRHTF